MGRYKPQFAPLHASSLSGSTVPSSPLSPLPINRMKFKSTKSKTASTLSLGNSIGKMKGYVPINDPMPWLWVCHKCNSRWPLGATRRCLHDGHHFCGGHTTDPITGKVRRHQACGSKFDYFGWQELRAFRDRLHPATSPSLSNDNKVHDCTVSCSYPSACHWKIKEDQAQAAAAAHKRDEEQAQKSQRGATSFDFLDPSRIAKATNDASSTFANGEDEGEMARSLRKATKKTGNYLNRLVNVAERKTSALLARSTSPDHEDDAHNALLTPGEEKAWRNPLRSNPTRQSMAASPPRIPELAFPSLDFEVQDGNGMLMDTDYAAPSPLKDEFALGFDESDEDEEDVDMGDLRYGGVGDVEEEESDYSSDGEISPDAEARIFGGIGLAVSPLFARN